LCGRAALSSDFAAAGGNLQTEAGNRLDYAGAVGWIGFGEIEHGGGKLPLNFAALPGMFQL
jgi:hypothetical protein